METEATLAHFPSESGRNSDPLVPAKAGTQNLATDRRRRLDSRLRGNERKKAIACQQAGGLVSDVMTKRAFNKIMRGLLDARAFLDGTANKSRYRVHYPPRRSKVRRVHPIHPGEVLREEFLVPLGLSAGALAKVMGVPRTRVERIAAESIGITADTALRLGKALGTSAQLWLNLQNRFDMETAERAIGKQLARISRVKAA